MTANNLILKLRSALASCGCSSLANMIKEPVILLSNNPIECHNIDGYSTSFTINATTAWHLTHPDWVRVSPLSGKAGNTVITIRVISLLNVGEKHRNGTIVIHQGKDRKSVGFRQRQLTQKEALEFLHTRILRIKRNSRVGLSNVVTMEAGEVVGLDFSEASDILPLFISVSNLSILVACFGKLKTLNVSNSNILGDINLLLSRLSTYNPELHSLVLDNNPFDKSTFVTPNILRLKKLTHLSLEKCNISGKIPAIANQKAVDMSEHGAVYRLQRASKGKGISIVILGDGFTDVEMAKGGYFEKIAANAMKAFFCIEPTKSFRNYFNVYVVKAISRDRGIGKGKNTVFSSYETENRTIGGDNDCCVAYAQKAPIEDNALCIITIVNDGGHSGSNYAIDNGNIAYCTLCNNLTEFNFSICHESVGHGLGDLLDEYVDPATASKIEDLKSCSHGANIDITCDKEKIKWRKFLALSQYKNSVGIFEGGLFHAKGVWRASETSTMRECYVMGFNAPSRYQIVSNIMKHAGVSYSFEEFLKYDKINL